MQKRIFISYAHSDEELKDYLIKHLSSLIRKEIISTWHDRKLIGGQNFDHEIKQELLDSDIILFLISSDFIASDYINDVELKRALEMHEQGNAIVVPVILRPCDWKDLKFGKFQALPRDAKPITEWGNIDQGFMSVIDGIKRIINNLSKKDPNDSIKNYSKETVNLPDHSILIFLPRGYIILNEIEYQENESWSIKAHYWSYDNNFFGGTHFHSNYKDYWQSIENRETQFNKLGIPIADQRFAEDVLDLIIDLRVRKKNDTINGVLELYKSSFLVFEYHKDEIELKNVTFPEKYKRLYQTGYIRDLIKEFSTSHYKNYDIETLHKKYNSNRRNALLWFCKKFEKDHPIIIFITEEVDKYDPSMNLAELREWANSMSSVLKDSLNHLP